MELSLPEKIQEVEQICSERHAEGKIKLLCDYVCIVVAKLMH